MKKIMLIVPIMAISLLASCGGGPSKTYYYLSKATVIAKDETILTDISRSDNFKELTISHNDTHSYCSYNKNAELNDKNQLVNELALFPDRQRSYNQKNEYTDSGLLASTFIHEISGSSHSYHLKEYFFNDSNRIRSIIRYNTDETGSEKRNPVIKNFSYQSSDKIETITETYDSEKAVKTITKYGDNSTLIVINRFDDEEPAGNEQYHYDEKGRLTRREIFNSSGKHVVWEKFEYNENNDVKAYYDLDYGYNIQYFYNEKGFLTSSTLTYDDGYVQECEFVTDENGVVNLVIYKEEGNDSGQIKLEYFTSDKEIPYLKDYQAPSKGNYFMLNKYEGVLFGETDIPSFNEDPQFDI